MIIVIIIDAGTRMRVWIGSAFDARELDGRPTLVQAPENVELAVQRREAVGLPCGRRDAGRGRSEIRPGLGGGVVHVQVIKWPAHCVGKRSGVSCAPT